MKNIKKIAVVFAIVALFSVSVPKTEAALVNVTICHNGVTEVVSGLQAIILIAQHKATNGACPVVAPEAPKHRAGRYATLLRLGILKTHTFVNGVEVTE